MPTHRPFHFNDIEAITRIYAEAVENGTGSYEIDAPDEKEMCARFTVLVTRGFPIFVAIADGELLGYAYVSYFRTRPAFRWMVENSIYVAPHVKGQGIGKLLLTELISRCTDMGFRQMLAVIGDASGNVASVRLHESLGFQPCGRIEGSGFKHDRWLDTQLMQLSMNGGNETSPGKPPLRRR